MRSERLLSHANWALSILLVVLTLGSSFIGETLFTVTLGRFHPLVVHIPIGSWVLIAGVFVFFKKVPEELMVFSLQLGAFFALLAALLGIFLATESSYTLEVISTHKYLGVAFSLSAYIVSWKRIRKSRILRGIVFVTSTVLLILTGHHGGSITHGEDFLFPSLKEKEQSVYDENASAYENIILPILGEKCISCHKPGKSKGKLNMKSPAAFLAGGESGPVLDIEDPESSIILDLVHLPLEDERHMPPSKKQQLDEEELVLLTEWIKAGSNFKKKIEDYEEGDPLRLAMERSLRKEAETVEYTFPPASSKVISSLNTDYRRVQPTYTGSPALDAQFFVSSKFKEQQVQELSKVQEQLVSLNLSNMPVNDEMLLSLPSFENLQSLFLSGTLVTSKASTYLTSLPQLTSLSLSNTKVDREIIAELNGLSKLEKLYISGTSLSPDDISEIKDAKPNLNIHYEAPSAEVIQLTSPSLVEENPDINMLDALHLTDLIAGTEIFYTTDPSADKASFVPYSGDIKVADVMHLRAFSTKNGWENSEIFVYEDFRKGIKPDSIYFESTPDKKYLINGAKKITDGERGNPAYYYAKKEWLGYIDSDFSVMCYFEEEVVIEKVVISYGVNLGASIFNPAAVGVEVNGNSEEIKLKTISEEEAGAVRQGFQVVELDPEPSNQVSIRVEKVARVPHWHKNKGSKGWLFIDEIYFYSKDSQPLL